MLALCYSLLHGCCHTDAPARGHRVHYWQRSCGWELSLWRTLPSRLSDQENAGRGRSLQRLCNLGRVSASRSGIFDAHGYSSSVYSFFGRCGTHLRTRILRRQGHHRGADCGCGTIAPDRHPCRSAVVAGEERDSLGAQVANEYAANGRLPVPISGQRRAHGQSPCACLEGTLRVEVTATGRMAHSAYPELGESAIDKLIPALTRLRAMPLPSDPDVGPCTLNIGLIEAVERRT